MKVLKIFSQLNLVVIFIIAVIAIFVQSQFLLYCGLTIALVAFVDVILLNRVFNIHIETVAENKLLSEQNGQIETNYQKERELLNRYKSALANADKLLEVEKTKNLESNANVHKDVLEAFKVNVTNPYFEMLRSVDMPVDEGTKQAIIDKTVDMAMKALDLGDAYDKGINNREEQNINLQKIHGQLSDQDAMDKAILMTDNPHETPKWTRALKQSLGGIVSNESGIIFSGYKIFE